MGAGRFASRALKTACRAVFARRGTQSSRPGLFESASVSPENKDKNKSDTHYQVSLCWWELVDSNDFMPPYPAEILTSTAKKIPCPCTFYWMGDFNLRGVNQKCGQKCGQTAPRREIFCSLTAPHQKRDFSLPRTGSEVKPHLHLSLTFMQKVAVIFWDFSVTILAVKHEFQKNRLHEQTCPVFSENPYYNKYSKGRKSEKPVTFLVFARVKI